MKMEKLKNLKKNITLEFIKGNSLITVPNYNNKETFDVINIDGGYGDLCAINDLKNLLIQIQFWYLMIRILVILQK